MVIGNVNINDESNDFEKVNKLTLWNAVCILMQGTPTSLLKRTSLNSKQSVVGCLWFRQPSLSI